MKQKLFSIFCCLLLSASMVTQAQTKLQIKSSNGHKQSISTEKNLVNSGDENAAKVYNRRNAPMGLQYDEEDGYVEGYDNELSSANLEWSNSSSSIVTLTITDPNDAGFLCMIDFYVPTAKRNNGRAPEGVYQINSSHNEGTVGASTGYVGGEDQSSFAFVNSGNNVWYFQKGSVLVKYVNNKPFIVVRAINSNDQRFEFAAGVRGYSTGSATIDNDEYEWDLVAAIPSPYDFSWNQSNKRLTVKSSSTAPFDNIYLDFALSTSYIPTGVYDIKNSGTPRVKPATGGYSQSGNWFFPNASSMVHCRLDWYYNNRYDYGYNNVSEFWYLKSGQVKVLNPNNNTPMYVYLDGKNSAKYYTVAEVYKEPALRELTVSTAGTGANGSASISCAENHGYPSGGFLAGSSGSYYYDGTTVTLVAPSANAGYHFVNWTKSGTSKSTNASYALGNVSSTNSGAYVANFAANTYNVVFNKNGGSGTMSNQSHTYGSSKALTSNAFTRSGYTFAGWATSAARANAGTVDYTNGQSVTNLTTTNNGNFNLYAVWIAEACTYEVAFNAHGGSGTMANQEFTCGEAQPLNPNAFTGPAATITYNYHGATSGNGTPSVTIYKPFGGWEDSVNDELHDDEEEVSYSVANGATVTMTAQWNAFEGVTLPTPVRTGYTFDGWYTEETGGTKKGNGGASFVPAESITLHAQWTANTHNVSITAPSNGTITVSYNDGSAQSFTSGSRSIAEGTVLTVTTTPASDYHFSAWTGNGAASVTVDGAKTIGATFAQNDYFLNATYGAGGASVTRSDNGNNETVKRAGNTVTLTPTAATGYEFLAWGGADAAKMSGNVFTFPTNGTHNTTYNVQATFQTITYDLTYNGLEGATHSNPATYTVETETITLTAPSARTGYTFTGWTCGGTPITQIAVGSTGDKTITANWTQNGYTVTLAKNNDAYGTLTDSKDNVIAEITGVEDNAGISISGNRLTIGSTTVTATAADKSADGIIDYEFVNWTDGDGNALPTMVTADMTIRANFTRFTTLCENCDNGHYTAFMEYDKQTLTAKLFRKFESGRWSTLCLPFDVNKNMFSSLNFGSRIYEFRYAEGNANDGSGVNLYFSIAKSIKAGQGYIVNANAALAARTSFTFPGVNIDLSKDNGAELSSVTAYDNLTGNSSDGNIELVGTLRKGTLKGTAADNRYMGLKENKIYYPNISTGSIILAYRGIFRSIEGTLNAERIRIIVDGEEKAELEIINGELQDVQETKKFIENGVLYIERNGIIYDATGRKVE